MVKVTNKVTKFCLFVILAIAGMTILGCDGGSNDSGDASNTPTYISIESTSPGNGAVDVATDISVTATFDSSIDDSTLTSNTVIISDGSDSISGTLSYSEVNKTVTFEPDSALDYGTMYTATITTAVKDSGGNTLESDYSWSFTIENHSIYGSYWGNMTVSGTDYNICLKVQEDKINMSSTVMSQEYTNIAYSEEGGIQSFKAYADDDTGQTGDVLCSGTFAMTNTIRTCIATVAMGTSTITTDTLWCITMDDLYGSYWGTMLVGSVEYSMCLDVRNGSVTLISTAMSFLYANVVYARDPENGSWTFAAYYVSDTTYSSPRVTGSFSVDDTGTVKTCVAEVIPMGTTTNTLTMGNDYNGEYGAAPTDPM